MRTNRHPYPLFYTLRFLFHHLLCTQWRSFGDFQLCITLISSRHYRFPSGTRKWQTQVRHTIGKPPPTLSSQGTRLR